MRAILIATGSMSVIGYHIGASVNQRHLKACLESTPHLDRLLEACYWKWEVFLFSSLFKASDLAVISTHRSILVGLIGLLLYFFMLRFTSSDH